MKSFIEITDRKIKIELSEKELNTLTALVGQQSYDTAMELVENHVRGTRKAFVHGVVDNNGYKELYDELDKITLRV